MNYQILLKLYQCAQANRELNQGKPFPEPFSTFAEKYGPELEQIESVLGDDLPTLVKATEDAFSKERLSHIDDVLNPLITFVELRSRGFATYDSVLQSLRSGVPFSMGELRTLEKTEGDWNAPPQDIRSLPSHLFYGHKALSNGGNYRHLPDDAPAQWIQMLRDNDIYNDRDAATQFAQVYSALPTFVTQCRPSKDLILALHYHSGLSYDPATDTVLAALGKAHPDWFQTDDPEYAADMADFVRSVFNGPAINKKLVTRFAPTLSVSAVERILGENFHAWTKGEDPFTAIDKIYGGDAALPLNLTERMLAHPALIGQKVSAIKDMEARYGHVGNAQYMDKLIGVFGASLPQFVAKFDREGLLNANLGDIYESNPKAYEFWRKKQGQLAHDLTQKLPKFKTRYEVLGLDRFLLNWLGKGMNPKAQAVAMRWPKLEPEQRKELIADLPGAYQRVLSESLKVPADYQHLMPMIEEANRWGTPFERRTREYDPNEDVFDDEKEHDPYMTHHEELNHYNWQGEKYPKDEGLRVEGTHLYNWNPWAAHPSSDRWNPWMAQELAADLPAWTKFSATVGGLTGRFLPREDPRGLFLGQYTNCCQHPDNAGADCAYHGQVSPYGAFFVVEDKGGDIVAQSWTWQAQTGGVCFDNVEANGIGPKRMPIVLHIYQDVARQMKDAGVPDVHIGGEMNDMDTDHLPQSEGFLHPKDYDGYTDSGEEQKVLYHPELAPVHDWRQPVPTQQPRQQNMWDAPEEEPEEDVPHWKDLLTQARGVSASIIALSLIRTARLCDHLHEPFRADSLERRARLICPLVK